MMVGRQSFQVYRLFAKGVLLFMFITLFFNVNAQTNVSGYGNVALQRLLIRTTAQYVHTVSQGQIDMDSAIRIPCEVYGLSPLLAYNEGYSDGKPTAINKLLDVGKVNAAITLMAKLKNEARLRALIELGTYYIFKPGEFKNDLALADKYITEAIDRSKAGPVIWQIEALTLKAHLLYQSAQIGESGKIYDNVVALCEQSGNRQATARALLGAGELLPFGDTVRLGKFQKALQIFHSLNEKEKEIEALSQINICYFATKQYDVAEAYLQKIVQQEAAINFNHQQYPYDALTWLTIRKGNLSAALAYSIKSLECVKSKGDSVFISTFYTRRGVLFGYLLKSREALTWFNKGMENHSQKNRLFWYRSFIGEVSTLNMLGKFKEALAIFQKTGTQFPPASVFEKMHYAFLLGLTYQNLKQNQLAENNYKTFLTIAEKFPLAYLHDEHPAAFLQISGFYREIGNTAKAKELLERGRLFISPTDMDRQSLYHYHLYKIDSIEKRYPEALRHLELSHVFNDSAYSFSQRKRTTELLVKYETEKKDKNIKLLNSQNQLARARANESERTKNITLIGIVLLLIIIGLLLSRYLIKQKSNLKLKASQLELDQKNIYLEKLNSDQEKLLKEKEWLIKEVHHRVKNNLQMVTSLLYSQSVYLDDAAAKLAIKDSLRRMQAMSLIHQKLYEDENTSTVGMPDYVSDLVRYLHESFDTDNRIIFEQNISPFELDVSQAIPLGLIITESIVNAIKYAFLNGESGVVSIELLEDGIDHIVLKITDNGVGLPVAPDKMQRTSLGLDLMEGLARQLNGSFKIENDKGVHITVRFVGTINKIES